MPHLLEILEGEIKTPGVLIPIHREIYTPILAELKQFGFDFLEEKVDLTEKV